MEEDGGQRFMPHSSPNVVIYPLKSLIIKYLRFNMFVVLYFLWSNLIDQVYDEYELLKQGYSDYPNKLGR